MRKFFTLMFLTLGLNACSSVGYISSSDLADMRASENSEMDIYGNEIAYSGHYNALPQNNFKSMGALTINRFNLETGENNPAMIDLKRNKSRFYAETKLFESDNKDKSLFDETYLNLGIDKKEKGLNMELTLKF